MESDGHDGGVVVVEIIMWKVVVMMMMMMMIMMMMMMIRHKAINSVNELLFCYVVIVFLVCLILSGEMIYSSRQSTRIW